jgi:hypothetical protein
MDHAASENTFLDRYHNNGWKFLIGYTPRGNSGTASHQPAGKHDG